MKYSELISRIKDRFSIKSQHISCHNEFYDVYLLDKSTNTFNKSALYIGHVSQLHEGCVPPLNLIYFGDKPDLCLSDINSVQIDEKDFAAVFNLINESITDSMRSENEYVDMLKMILDGKSLSVILDAAAEKTHNSFVVIDISGKILAHSTSFNVPDPVWIESAAKGYCSYEFMEHIKKVRFKKLSPKSSEAFVTVCEDTHLTYLCSKILSHDTLLGYVFMFETAAPINKECREILPSISRAACEMIVRTQDSYSLRTNLYHSILSDMLAGIDPDHANARIQVSELKFPERMCVLVVRPSYYHGEHYVTGFMEEAILNIFSSLPFLNYQGSIILVASLNESQKIEPDKLRKLTELAESEHLQVGISNGFTQITSFAAYYAQANDALRFAQRLDSTGCLFFYQDYAFYVMLSTLPSEIKPGRFCHPALGLLRKYDHANGTKLYHTLKVYTETCLNQRHTAEILFLHRNTLNYRMHRIEEITGISFDNPKTLFQLMYSFKIDELNENEI